MAYTDIQLGFILKKGNQKANEEVEDSWDDITDEFNYKYGTNHTKNAIRKKYTAMLEKLDQDPMSDDTLAKNLQATYTARKASNKLRKEVKVLAENTLTNIEFLDKIRDILKDSKIKKIKIPKTPKSKNKTKMVVEPILSDIHFGLETKSYNAGVARRRVKYYAETIIKEIKRKEKLYSIEKIHIPLLADFLQSATMHKDSSQSCHLTNAEQMATAVESLFYDFILPLAKTGYTIDITGLCGNHDRESTEQHTVNPGKTYYTYTIYKTLEMLCKQSGLKKVTFEIPNNVYAIKEILGKYFIYEHGHVMKGKTADAMEKHLIKRQAQVEKIVSGIRVGHYHNDLISSMGRHIMNASTVSDDHYGDLLGYKSRPAQVLAFYVECKRDTSFFHAISVDLSEV